MATNKENISRTLLQGSKETEVMKAQVWVVYPPSLPRGLCVILRSGGTWSQMSRETKQSVNDRWSWVHWIRHLDYQRGRKALFEYILWLRVI